MSRHALARPNVAKDVVHHHVAGKKALMSTPARRWISVVFFPLTTSSSGLLTVGDVGAEGGLPSALSIGVAAAIAFIASRRSDRERIAARIRPRSNRRQLTGGEPQRSDRIVVRNRGDVVEFRFNN